MLDQHARNALEGDDTEDGAGRADAALSQRQVARALPLSLRSCNTDPGTDDPTPAVRYIARKCFAPRMCCSQAHKLSARHIAYAFSVGTNHQRRCKRSEAPHVEGEVPDVYVREDRCQQRVNIASQVVCRNLNEMAIQDAFESRLGEPVGDLKENQDRRVDTDDC